MKFYTENQYIYIYFNRIKKYKLTAIYFSNPIWFFKNGESHNAKNACFVKDNMIKSFDLYGEYYGDQTQFTKKSCRKFVKLQAFL